MKFFEIVMGGPGDGLGSSGMCLGVFGTAGDAQGTFRSDRGEQQKKHQNVTKMSILGSCILKFPMLAHVWRGAGLLHII